MMFEVVWEDCIQEEIRVANREALLKEDDQALATHTKKRRRNQPIFKKGNLPDTNIKHEGICKGCAKGKNIKNPFPKSETKTKGTLELIHSDVYGPMYSTSLSGFEY